MSDSDEEFGVGPARPVSRRRRWSEAERLRIVAVSYQPGVSVSLLARRHDMNANLLFTWRRRYGKRAAGAGSGGLVPVVVEPAGPPAAESAPGSGPAAGRVEIALSDGSRAIVDREVHGSALARVLWFRSGEPSITNRSASTSPPSSGFGLVAKSPIAG